MLLECVGDLAQQLVAGSMAVMVVDLLESVDVDVGEDEQSVCSSGTHDLAPQQEHSDSSAERASELVELSGPQFGLRVLIIVVSGESIGLSLLAIGSRVLAIVGRLASIRGPLVSLHLGLPSVRRRQFSIRGGAFTVIGSLPSIRDPLVGVDLRLIAI